MYWYNSPTCLELKSAVKPIHPARTIDIDASSELVEEIIEKNKGLLNHYLRWGYPKKSLTSFPFHVSYLCVEKLFIVVFVSDVLENFHGKVRKANLQEEWQNRWLEILRLSYVKTILTYAPEHGEYQRWRVTREGMRSAISKWDSD